MEYYRFWEDTGIHELDYSGKIDLAEGLVRMEQLEKSFSSCASGTTLKILLDVRNTIWEDVQTHDTLAKIARQKFDTEPKGVRRYVAVLNNQYQGQTFENERWFINKSEALEWLASLDEQR